MIAIKTIGLILEPLFSWLLTFVVGFVVGIVLGEDETVGILLLGTNGEAMAPSEPGLLGSASHFFNGAPHRNGFCPKDEPEKPDKDAGISPERTFPETLKSCKPGR
jgi:hypothetical protein